MTSFNRLEDPRLTKTGGLPFDVWHYIARLELAATDEDAGNRQIDQDFWLSPYNSGRTPRDAVDEYFR